MNPLHDVRRHCRPALAEHAVDGLADGPHMATEAQKDCRLARLQHEYTEQSPAPEHPQEPPQKQRHSEDAPRRA